MRLLLVLWTFFALALAPLGATAEARAAEVHCGEMANGSETKSPAKDKSCCPAVTAALPSNVEAVATPALRPPLTAAALPSQTDVRGDVEVPPPRS